MNIDNTYSILPRQNTSDPIEENIGSALYNEWMAWEQAGLGRGESRDMAVKRLCECLSINAYSLDLSCLELTCLPDNLPPALGTLDVSRNRLTHLPENLPPGLYSLSAITNQLIHLPEKLPPSLTELLVQFNHLISLPENLPPKLEKLSVNNNHLVSLPENLPPLLYKLHVENNQLTRLPVNLPTGLLLLYAGNNQISRLSAGLEMLSPRAIVDISGNPFSQEVLDRLARICHAPNYSGPQFFFAMASSMPPLPVRPLSECVSGWVIQSTERWGAIEKEPGTPAFSRFLDHLRGTVNYENAAFRHSVSTWLNRLVDENSQALRALSFQIAEEATQSCEDRVSLAFNQMKILSLAQEVEVGQYDNRLPELVELARGLFRLECLEKMAREKAASLTFVDEIEVYLAYQVKLRERLALPLETQDMRFFGVSWVTEEDLARAEERVKQREAMEFRHYLSTNWQPWQAVLKRLDRTGYDQARKQVNEAMEARFEKELATRLNAEQLEDDEDAARQLGVEVKQDIERDIMSQLTTTFFQRYGLAALSN